VEQNRDGQLRTLLVTEGALSPMKLTPVLHYDGTPITARFIHREIAQRLAAFNVTPMRRTALGDAAE
jgi:2-oxoglutarate/2-oxoacid ferredoxin oxidoreductase subunit alpha